MKVGKMRKSLKSEVRRPKKNQSKFKTVAIQSFENKIN